MRCPICLSAMEQILTDKTIFVDVTGEGLLLQHLDVVALYCDVCMVRTYIGEKTFDKHRGTYA